MLFKKRTGVPTNRENNRENKREKQTRKYLCTFHFVRTNFTRSYQERAGSPNYLFGLFTTSEAASRINWCGRPSFQPLAKFTSCLKSRKRRKRERGGSHEMIVSLVDLACSPKNAKSGKWCTRCSVIFAKRSMLEKPKEQFEQGSGSTTSQQEIDRQTRLGENI